MGPVAVAQHGPGQAAGARDEHRGVGHGLASALIVSGVGWAASSFFISTETSRPLWFLIGLTLALAKLTSAYEASNAPRSARAP